MWYIVVGWLIGRNIGSSSLPDSVKQERYDKMQARRAAKKANRSFKTSEMVVGVLLVMLVLSLLIRGFQALFG